MRDFLNIREMDFLKFKEVHFLVVKEVYFHIFKEIDFLSFVAVQKAQRKEVEFPIFFVLPSFFLASHSTQRENERIVMAMAYVQAHN